MSTPSGVARSRPRLCLPRLECSSRTCTLSGTIAVPLEARPRIASPRCTCSILMTSAPQSDINADAAGTNVCSATSRMRTPFITAVMTGSIPMWSSVRRGQWLGLLDLQRRSVDGERTRACLGAQQLQAELLVGVALAEQGAVLGRRSARPGLGRLRLLGRHLGAAARDGDVGVRG